MTHVRAWDLIVKSSLASAIVIEDDSSQVNFERLSELQCPDSFDIVFVNDRALNHEPRNDEVSNFRFDEIKHSLKRVENRCFSIGTDGYIVSFAGASKLLSLIKKDFYGGHVDMRMLAYCLVRPDLDVLPNGAFRTNLSHIMDRVGHAGLLGYSMTPCLTMHRSDSNSARIREDGLGNRVLSQNANGLKMIS